MEETLHPIFCVAPWVRIIMVRGVAALGRVCDPRTNAAILARPRSDAHWRAPDNRFSVVAWKSDAQAQTEKADVLRHEFGSSRLTLVYNYAETASVCALAELLLEAFDVKLAGFRSLPPVWWFGLGATEIAAVAALQRVEFKVHGDPQGQLGMPELLQQQQQHQTVPKGFDPIFNVTSDPIALAKFCAGYMCIEVGSADMLCLRCRRRLCVACYALGNMSCCGDN